MPPRLCRRSAAALRAAAARHAPAFCPGCCFPVAGDAACRYVRQQAAGALGAVPPLALSRPRPRVRRLYCGSQPLPLEPGVRVYLSQALPGLRLRLDGTPAEDDGGSGSDDDEGDNSATTDGSSGPGGGDDDDSASPDGTSQDRGTSGWDAVADWAA